MKFKMRSLCFVALGLASVFALGAGSASAANTLLFHPASGQFPYHAVGLTTAASELETVGKKKIRAGNGYHVLLLVLTPTLADVHILFLHTFAEGSEANMCGTKKASELDILIELLAHLGLAHPGDVPAALLLVPSGFEFKCSILGIEAGIKVKGGVVGKITEPPLGVEASKFELEINQTAGKQELTEFLLPGGVLMTEHLTSTILGSEEESGQSAPKTAIEPLAGEGNFLLIAE